MNCSDNAEGLQLDDFLPFMLHELVFRTLLHIRSHSLRIRTVAKFYNHLLRLRYG